MAPFNTHFLIAETLWSEFAGPWTAHYGQFCFGNMAPDVDKVSTTLTQKDTHFFDRTGDYSLMASHRSVEFIRRQGQFFSRPFAELSAAGQAFALGYLCHLCVDEVSKRMWRRETWLKFRDIGPGPAFAALDEVARRRVKDYPAIERALGDIELLEIIPHIPRRDLEATLHGVRRFVQAATVEEEYLVLVDLFDRPDPATRWEKLRIFRETIDLAGAQIGFFELDTLVQASLRHSRQRMTALISGRIPEPGAPALG